MALRDRHLIDDEQVVLELHTHAKAMLRPFLLFLALVAGAVVTLWASTNDIVTWVVLGALVVVALVGVFWPWLNWRTHSYSISTERVSERSGVITQRGRDIPLYRINTVSIEKDLIDRILGCGTLVIADGSEKGGMVLHDVPNVDDVQRTVQQLLANTDDGSDDGEFPPNEPQRGVSRR